MSFGTIQGSPITHTHLRTPQSISPISGMCSVCTANCVGPCEIGLSALRGDEALYPYATDVNQFASEKVYPVDFSHLNINGRVFGAWGCEEDSNIAAYPNVSVETTFGRTHPIPLKAPIILPAMAKLNWQDYFAGAALAGVLVVIGEDVISKDSGLELKDGKVASSPLLRDMVSAFKAYDHGCGDVILQANVDDEVLGVLDYAITHLGIKSVELKFGQAAKGIQGISRLKDIKEAIRFHEMGYLIFPDPTRPEIQAAYAGGEITVFEKTGRLPMWNESGLKTRIETLRGLGAEHICFKTGPFDSKDMVRLLKIACDLKVDLVTFDGAGGGTGNSPVKMMNEWGMPTIQLESMVYDILQRLGTSKNNLPQVAIAGGFAMEDQVFKGLALGAPYIGLVGIGRAAMAAAMTGKQVGQTVEQGKATKEFERFGTSMDELFAEAKSLRALYEKDGQVISPGAIGLYSYLQRIKTGLRQLMALNRRFELSVIERTDVVPLTEAAAKITGLASYDELVRRELLNL